MPRVDEGGATARLADVLHDRFREETPRAVLDAAQAVVLDAVGCLFAGIAERPSRIGRDYVLAAGGSGPSSVVGRTDGVDAAGAAYANGITIHALDFEPIGSPPCHAPASVLPAVLALAERSGSSGRDLLASLAIGWEVESALRAAGRLRSAFHPLAVYGPVAAAAASAALLGLDARGIENAIAIGASAAGGLAANGHSPVKVVHSGVAAQAGVVAALQAQHGLVGSRAVLEARGGYGDAFYSEVDWGVLERLTAGPDAVHALSAATVLHKPYPVQLPILNVIDTVLDVRPDGFDPSDLESLELTVSSLIASRSNPRPERGHAGKFSPEFCAAAALRDGGVGIGSFEDARLHDARLLDVIDRVVVVERKDAGVHEVAVRLRTRSGAVLKASRSDPRGTAAAPLSGRQLVDKVRGCLEHAGAAGITDDLVACIGDLAAAGDVSDLTALLRTRVPTDRKATG